jgi:hypothetical protein
MELSTLAAAVETLLVDHTLVATLASALASLAQPRSDLADSAAASLFTGSYALQVRIATVVHVLDCDSRASAF